jgi:hypothetical protein
MDAGCCLCPISAARRWPRDINVVAALFDDRRCRRPGIRRRLWAGGGVLLSDPPRFHSSHSSGAVTGNRLVKSMRPAQRYGERMDATGLMDAAVSRSRRRPQPCRTAQGDRYRWPLATVSDAPGSKRELCLLGPLVRASGAATDFWHRDSQRNPGPRPAPRPRPRPISGHEARLPAPMPAAADRRSPCSCRMARDLAHASRPASS